MENVWLDHEKEKNILDLKYELKAVHTRGDSFSSDPPELCVHLCQGGYVTAGVCLSVIVMIGKNELKCKKKKMDFTSHHIFRKS